VDAPPEGDPIGDGVEPGASRPTAWQTATVVGLRDETPSARTFRLALARPFIHRAGQHVVVRLTAPDGYTASRSYSVASAPGDGSEIELTVERLVEGEVSSFLHDEVVVGDTLEVRGPIGGWFVWDGRSPALLVAGGSGLVPLMAMLRLARGQGTVDQVCLVVSVRDPGSLYYGDELPGPETTVLYTRQGPPDDPRPVGRLRAEDLAGRLRDGVTAFVCGSSGFADTASDLLVGLGLAPDHIRVERFGPTQ
jgi:ferredoxin-NADP reductase